MLLYNGNAFIPTWDSTVNKLFVVDCNTDQVTQTIQLPGYAPKEMVLDKNNKIWLLSGNLQANKQAYFTQIDPATYQVLNTYPFPSTADPLRPTLNPTKDTIYYIEINYAGGTDNNGVYRMPVSAAAVPSVPFKQAQQYQYYYAVSVDPNTGNVYISDPKGFTQKGTVYIYHPDGSAVSQFNTGVGPGHFYFD
jgi:DNA-binding beta-propeller fold protein YncE